MTAASSEQIAVEHGLRGLVRIEGHDTSRHTLAERMERYRIPGASIAVVDRGEIAWATGYGHRIAGRSGVDDAVTPATRFQAASVSKLVTALAALALVDQNVVDLDTDVNRWLRRWRVPDNELTRAQPVTLRHLLTHTAGTTVPSFAGYAPEAPLPTTEQILRGESPAVGEPVTVDARPGTIVRYSGGGTTIVQLLIEDATGAAFPQLVDELVFAPAGMNDSGFDQRLQAHRRPNTASGHDASGVTIPRGMRVHPELAAAGMWSTAVDLARLIVAIGNAVAEPGSAGAILSSTTARQAVTAHRPGGRGLIGNLLPDDGPVRWYAHDGANTGYRARVQGGVDRACGLVVMTNGDGGAALIGEVRAAVAEVYGWPDPVTRHVGVVEVPSRILDRYAGRYVDQQGSEVTIVHDDGVLVAPTPYGRRALVPIDSTRFLDNETGVEIVFCGGDGEDGPATRIAVFHEGAEILSYVRPTSTA